MTYNKREFERHRRDAVETRDIYAGQDRLRTAFFIALVGPLGILAIKFFSFNVTDWMRWVIYGSMPVSILFLIVGFMQVPGAAKFARKTVLISLLTLAAAAATYPLCRQFLP